MNLDVMQEFILTEDVRDIERRFCRFYLTVIKDYFDLDEDFFCIEKEDPYRGKHTESQNFRIFNQPDELLRFFIQDTCLGLRKFYASLTNYKEIVNYLSKKNLVTIYCVLGESLFAALGICIVIDEAVEQYKVSQETVTKQIELIVTEKEKNCRNICSYIVERVNSCYKNVEIKLELIADYSTRLSVEVSRALKEVDIVVMARYISHFPYLRIRMDFLEVILKRMKELSILFYLDACHERYYNTLKHLILKTDSLLEIRSEETMYELFEDAGNKEYCLEFLYTTAFKEVTFSTYVKCNGIKDNNCLENDTKEDITCMRNSTSNVKQQICNRFKKENSHPSSEVKYLLISSKSFSKIANGKTHQEMASWRKNFRKSPKKTDNANILPTISLISTFHKKNKKKPPKHPKDGNVFTPSTSSVELKEENTLKIEIIKTRKGIDVIASPIPRNKYAYSSEEMKQSAKTTKTNNINETLFFTNLQNNHQYYKEENKSSAATAKTNEDFEKISPANLQNIYKYSTEEKKPSAKTAKTSNVVEKLSATNLQNIYKYSKGETKPSAKTAKTSNVFEKISSANLPNKYSKEEYKKSAKTAKTSDCVEKLSSTNLHNKNEYFKEEKKQSTKTDKTSNIVEKLAFTNSQNKCKYSRSEKKQKAETVKTAVENLTSSNLHNKNKYFKEEKKPSAKTNKTSNVVEKLASTNSQNKCKYSRRGNKPNAETVKTAVENLTSTNLHKKNNYFKAEMKKNFKTVTTNTVVRKFLFVHLQVKCKHSGKEEKPNVKSRKKSKAVQKLGPTNQQNKIEYKCPHLRTEESISDYAELLGEIYYFEHFSKKNKYC